MPVFEFPMTSKSELAEVILVVNTSTRDVAAQVANAIMNNALTTQTKWEIHPDAFNEVETFGDPASENQEANPVPGQHRPNLVYPSPMF